MKKILLLVAVALFLFSCESKQVKIAFMGDSITIGAGLANPDSECYPSVLASKLQEEFGDKYVVGNFSVSGRTMLRHGDRPLWNEDQFPASLKFNPDIVYVMLGTNDSKPQNWDEYSAEFYTDYKAMLDTFLVINPKVKFVMAVPPPAFKVQWGIRDSVIVNGVVPVVRQLAEEYNATLVDYYVPLQDSEAYFPDAIHPNSEGAVVMAGILFSTLKESSIIK